MFVWVVVDMNQFCCEQLTSCDKIWAASSGELLLHSINAVGAIVVIVVVVVDVVVAVDVVDVAVGAVAAAEVVAAVVVVFAAVRRKH